MTQPVRLQLSRRNGFDLAAHSRATNGREVVHVGRPGPWGNPFVVGKHGDAARCVELHQALLAGWVAVGPVVEVIAMEKHRKFVAENVAGLRGKNLACWCRPGAPCHADTLLEIANREQKP